MAKIEVDGQSFEVEDGTRLVLALEDNGVDVLHRCGGFAGCTTCRVEFSEGEPTAMTVAERDVLEKRGFLGSARLSCQIACEGSMVLSPVMRVSTSNVDGPGGRPEDTITPDPEWI
ncbi:MAG: 2Fe-2S iron-sulfur cluster-binding protein [Acidimicrobiia bacterium]|nr:2Fe-2S iron-sulfur cluster-binding protein [Acidimicrobiia bacterium]